MTRSLAACIIIAAAAIPFTGSTRAISVSVANHPIQAQAIEQSGRILLPLRDAFEALNSTVSYDAATRVITARNILHRVSLRVGSTTAHIDGRKVSLESPARMVNGRIYVPLRFAAQAMGAIVQYDPRTRTVAINGSEPATAAIDAAHPPQELNPPPNSSVVTAYPVVSASLGSATAASNAITLSIDGTDVTAQAAFDGRTITYVPRAGLAQGRHTASFSGRTASGQPFSNQWSFVTSEPPMDSDPGYAYGDYRFYGGPLQPFGPTSSLMNLTLIGPPTGSGFVQICSPSFIYPLWNGGTQWYRGRVVLPRTFTPGGCPITAIYVGRNGRRFYVPITPMNNGLYITGNPLNPIGQYPSAPLFVPVLPIHH